MAGALLSVQEAERIILEHARDVGIESCPLDAARGRILRQDVLADRDLPPFDRVTMDGIAIATAAWRGGRRMYRVAFSQPAGQPERALQESDACAKVMTGAILPPGADCVVPREHVQWRDGEAEVAGDAPVAPMQFVHRRGVDAKAGAVVLSAGRVLRAPDLLIAAAVGGVELRVARAPSAAIVSNGDEIVPVEASPRPHQIRTGNTHALRAGLQQCGVTQIEAVHFPDDRERMLRGIAGLLERVEMLVLTGGVSAGEFDYLPGVLEEVGVERIFHGVKQRPGKPFWFGKSRTGVPVFALPGNPVSTLVCFHRYIRPWLARCMGGPMPAPAPASLVGEVRFTQPLTYFLQVVEEPPEQGARRVRPASHHGSGDYVSLSGTDGFVELPAELEYFPAGFTAPFHAWS